MRQRFLKLLPIAAFVPYEIARCFSDEKKLVQVLVLHRHGARSNSKMLQPAEVEEEVWVPRMYYGKEDFHWHAIQEKCKRLQIQTLDGRFSDEYDSLDMYWNKKAFLGQLTKLGASQLVCVGENLRRRYIDELNFLPKQLDEALDMLEIRAVNVSRCILSADCLMSGLYPDNASETLAPLQIWPPPAWLFPDNTPPYNTEQKEHWFWPETKHKSEEAKKIEKSMKKRRSELEAAFFTPMFDHLHELAPQIKSRDKFLWGVADSYEAYATHNVELECFKDVSEGVVVALEGYLAWTLREHFGGKSRLPYVSNLGIGFVSEQLKNGSGFRIESCHDISIFPILCALGHGEEWPSYASYLVFEVWESSSGKEVRVYYNDTLLAIDGRTEWELDKFLEFMKDRAGSIAQ